MCTKSVQILNEIAEKKLFRCPSSWNSRFLLKPPKSGSANYSSLSKDSQIFLLFFLSFYSPLEYDSDFRFLLFLRYLQDYNINNIYKNCIRYIQTGVVPNILKVFQVTPAYKSGDVTNPGNYRPISILSPFSKVLEKSVYNQLYDFLEKHNILYRYQFGFRKGHSTEQVIMVKLPIFAFEVLRSLSAYNTGWYESIQSF